MSLKVVAGEPLSSCPPCAPIFQMPCGRIDGVKKSNWFVGGHVEAGLYGDFPDRQNKYRNGVFILSDDETASGFQERTSGARLDQLYVNIGKKLNARHGLDVGGRVDFMYGTDAVFLQSDGFERDGDRSLWRSGDYFSSIPQIFVEVGYKNFSVKLGKFLSPMENESILSPERFFYSMSPTAMALPQTFTGVVGTWEINKRFTVLGGWVGGEDETFTGERENAFLGDIFFQWTKHVKIGYSTYVRMDSRDRIDGDAIAQSFSVNFSGSKWDYKFQWMLRGPKTGIEGRLDAYGLRQELVYKFSPKWSIGGRVDWMRRHTKAGQAYDRYSVTFGVNWKPTSWITIRPEIRYDNNDGTRPYFKPKDGSPGGRRDRFTGGASAVITF